MRQLVRIRARERSGAREGGRKPGRVVEAGPRRHLIAAGLPGRPRSATAIGRGSRNYRPRQGSSRCAFRSPWRISTRSCSAQCMAFDRKFCGTRRSSRGSEHAHARVPTPSNPDRAMLWPTCAPVRSACVRGPAVAPRSIPTCRSRRLPCDCHPPRKRCSLCRRAAPWRPDLHVLDFHLDGGHAGLDAWRQRRAHHADVSTVMLTVDRQVRQRLLDAVISVLYRPLKPLALRQMLHRIAAGAR